MTQHTVEKIVSTLPTTLSANTVYLVRVGSGFDIYVSDSTGSVAHALNDTFLIESGSNSNGTYRKYRDGTLKCYKAMNGVLCNSALGGLYRSPSDITWTFPHSFSGDDRVVTGHVDGASSWVAPGSSTTTSSVFRRYMAVNDGSTGRTVNLIAEGFWE